MEAVKERSSQSSQRPLNLPPPDPNAVAQAGLAMLMEAAQLEQGQAAQGGPANAAPPLPPNQAAGGPGPAMILPPPPMPPAPGGAAVGGMAAPGANPDALFQVWLKGYQLDNPLSSLTCFVAQSLTARLMVCPTFMLALSRMQMYDGLGGTHGPLLVANGQRGLSGGPLDRYRTSNVAGHVHAALIMVLLPIMIKIGYDPHSTCIGWNTATVHRGCKIVEGYLPIFMSTQGSFTEWWLNTMPTMPDIIREAMTALLSEVNRRHAFFTHSSLTSGQHSQDGNTCWLCPPLPPLTLIAGDHYVPGRDQSNLCLDGRSPQATGSVRCFPGLRPPGLPQHPCPPRGSQGQTASAVPWL